MSSRMLVPIGILSHPGLSLTARVLLVYVAYRNPKTGNCHLPTHSVCRLVGRTNQEGEVTDEDVKAVRQARSTLSKKGYLKHRLVRGKPGKSPNHVYTIETFTCFESSLAELNRLGSLQKNPIRYRDHISRPGSKTPAPESESESESESYDPLGGLL